MSESANNGAANGDHARRLWDLVADAIVAAHVRLASGSHADSIQFLYMFLDYLRLALPGPPHLLVARSADLQEAKTAPALSTRTGGVTTVTAGDSAYEACAFCDAVTFLLDRTDHEQPARGTFDDLLTQLRQVASQRAPRIGQRLGQTLLDGLNSVIEQMPAAETADSPVCDSGATSTASAPADVGTVVAAVQQHLAEALSGADLSYELVLRNWHGPQPTYSVFGFREGDADRIEPDGHATSLRDDPDRKQWRPVVEAALNTGFAQVAALQGREEQLFVVPCHFGGVPWLAVCRPVQLIDHGDWWAYSTYRDLIPRLNDAVRMAGWRSLFEEMKRLFVDEAVPSVAGDPGRLAEVVNTFWATLPRVFPVPPPCLEAVAETDATPDEVLLTILGRQWRVSFAGSANAYFPAALPAEVGASGRWGRFSERELQRGFVVPVQARLHMEQARVDTELAENIYAIGHPLKHRLGRVRQAVDTELEALKIEPFDREDAKYHCQRARLFTRQVEGTAATMDLMANLCQHNGNVALLDSKFLATDPYRIGPHVRDILSQFAAAESAPRLDEAALAMLDRLSIEPTISTTPLPSRLFDTFYDDVFFELLVNADRHCPRQQRELRVAYEPIDTPADGSAERKCIVIANTTRERNFERLRLEPGQWTTWQIGRDGPKGGLRLIASQLHLTGAGELLARPSQSDGAWWFSVAVCLRGLHLKEDSLQGGSPNG